MEDFDLRFVKLCGKEPALWQPGHPRGLHGTAAAERISAALRLKGFGAEKVKPMFDRVRALYEEELANRARGRSSELRWFYSMDSYLRPFVGLTSGDSSSCSDGDVCSNAKSTESIEDDDDVPCDVCRSTIPEDRNEMIFCSSCNVCVHQACYGVGTVPQDDWHCAPCCLSIQPRCALCPKEGGAMKRSSDGKQWAHVSCAWWIKEVSIGIPEKMEPIHNISKIPTRRWNLICSLCQMKYGACIQCVEPHCTIAYHVTCAFDKGLRMDLCDDTSKDGVKLLSYCRRHGEKKPRKKKPPKKKPQRDSRDGAKDHTASQKVRPLSHRRRTCESVTSTSNDNESLESESRSDDSNQTSGSESLLANQSGRTIWKGIVGDGDEVALRRSILGLRPLSNPGQLPEQWEGAPKKPCHSTMSGKASSKPIVDEGGETRATATQSFERHSNATQKEHWMQYRYDTTTQRVKPQTSFDSEQSDEVEDSNYESHQRAVLQNRLQISCDSEPLSRQVQKRASFNKTSCKSMQVTKSRVKRHQRQASSDIRPPAKKIKRAESSESNDGNLLSYSICPIESRTQRMFHEHCSDFENQPSASEEEHCSRFIDQPSPKEEEQYSPCQNRPSATEEQHCSCCRYQPSAKLAEHWSPHKNQPSGTKDEHRSRFRSPPTTSATYFVRKKIIKAKSAARRNSNEKKENYRQFAKLITVFLQSLSPEKAKQFQARIIAFCLSNSRKNSNPQKKSTQLKSNF